MNWDAIGAIGEVVGGISVVLTLFYLAYQVRDARKQMKQSFALAHQEADREMVFEMIRNETLSNASLKMLSKESQFTATSNALKKYGDLTDEEALAMNGYLVVQFRVYADQIRNVELLEDEQILTLRTRLKFTYTRIPARVWFDSYAASNTDDAIVRYVEEARGSPMDVGQAKGVGA